MTLKWLIPVLLLLSFNAEAQKKIKWPNHKKAVIVLTYDDALDSQLNTAVPQLESAGLKATFFLTGDINRLTIPKWRALSKRGFELGNHTIYHPCSSSDDNPVASETYTLGAIVREIEIMNNYLFAIDGKATHTFAYPCTETTVGHGQDYSDSLRKYGLVKYARIGGDVDDGVITDFKHLDLMKIPSYGLEDNTPGEKLIAFVKRVEKSGGMGIFMIHGVGGDYITTSTKAHRELITYLKENKKDIWITTFQQAMDYAVTASKTN
ncbi:polysaccharide deacetylase family protein [Mucilaginibacter sp. X5P1]|uniref:polysaccharide deacetylase family protein n=1 Tax=Mucilaginibacter sp. X5P1 TaxID=2723088 RepID=UPI00161D830F|nr:polysaccharide deacetylase family protein [Mucilaginibacter sp. X5P1]MBB6141432.1 peptidoglycan/xylan/chitin deacetylase (PgdA/CDA1 family) [Mucilaginibacter sp. X5P1]